MQLYPIMTCFKPPTPHVTYLTVLAKYDPYNTVNNISDK